MKLLCLKLSQLDPLDDWPESTIIPGLKEIRMRLINHPFSFAFLPVLSSTHPTLQTFWLFDEYGHYFPHHTPPFMSSFIEESQRQGLRKFFKIEHGVALRRDLGQTSPVWYIMSLTLTTTSASTSLIEVLTLVASSFPKLEMLTLNLNDHQSTYQINDLAAALGLFLSLRTLFLDGVSNPLNLQASHDFLPPVRQVDTANASDVSHSRVEILWLTSLVAKAAKNLDIINIKDGRGYEQENGKTLKECSRLEGWLHVLNGNRDISGTLDRQMERVYPSTHVSLDTRMLPSDSKRGISPSHVYSIRTLCSSPST
ncbi:hypothetical protein FB446DRAFT_760756 [Lentinula raphanica]|nr:hypothetical protein FB446DRAFT_760756 [Lentinula raphanica]